MGGHGKAERYAGFCGEDERIKRVYGRVKTLKTSYTIDDVNKVAICLSRLKPVQNPPNSLKNPALKLIDCVLSLERKYHEFVVPRINIFQTKHPQINSLEELDKFITSCGGTEEFFNKELDYFDNKRALTFKWVLYYFRKIIELNKENDESKSLYSWAISVVPSDYKQMLAVKEIGSINVPGFGLAGWQYARMLFGADTCKPDRYIRDFVIACLEKTISRLTAVELMEKAAPLAGISVREADRRVWSLKRQKD
jgi:hypothetical protein